MASCQQVGSEYKEYALKKNVGSIVFRSGLQRGLTGFIAGVTIIIIIIIILKWPSMWTLLLHEQLVLPWLGGGWCSWWSCEVAQLTLVAAWAPSLGLGVWCNSPAPPERRSCWLQSRSRAVLGRNKDWVVFNKEKMCKDYRFSVPAVSVCVCVLPTNRQRQPSEQPSGRQSSPRRSRRPHPASSRWCPSCLGEMEGVSRVMSGTDHLQAGEL